VFRCLGVESKAGDNLHGSRQDGYGYELVGHLALGVECVINV